MTSSQIATQLVVGALAVMAIVWATREVRREPSRIALGRGVDLPSIGLVLLVIVLSIPGLYFVFARELIPKGSPIAFASFLGFYAVGTIALAIAIVTRRIRAAALGWLTLEPDGGVRVETSELDEALPLAAGSVRAVPVAGKPQHLQLHLPLRDGSTLLVLAMVPIRDLALAEPGEARPPRGLVAQGGGAKLCDHLRPFFASP